MKLFRQLAAAALVASAAVLPLSAQVRVKGEAAMEKKDNKIAMKYLDTDGFVLGYMDYKPAKADFSAVIDLIFQAIGNDPDDAKIKAVLSDIWNQSGLNAYETCGSSAKTNRNFYTVKTFVGAPAAKRQGVIFDLVEKPAAKGLPMLNFAPEDTALAIGMNFNSAALWKCFLVNFEKYANDDMKAEFKQGMIEAKTTLGVEVASVAESISAFSVFVSSSGDPAAQILPGTGIADITIMLEVKNDAFFNGISNLLVKNQKGVLQNGEIALQLPVPRKVMMFQNGNYVVATTAPEKIKAMLAGKAKNVTSTPAFKKWSAGTPENGYAYIYASPDFGPRIMMPLIALATVKFQACNFDFMKCAAILGLNQPLYLADTFDENGIFTVCNTGSRPLAALGGTSAFSWIYTMPIQMAAIGGWYTQARACSGVPLADDDSEIIVEETEVDLVPAKADAPAKKAAPAPAAPAK